MWATMALVPHFDGSVSFSFSYVHCKFSSANSFMPTVPNLKNTHRPNLTKGGVGVRHSTCASLKFRS